MLRDGCLHGLCGTCCRVASAKRSWRWKQLELGCALPADQPCRPALCAQLRPCLSALALALGTWGQFLSTGTLSLKAVVPPCFMPPLFLPLPYRISRRLIGFCFVQGQLLSTRVSPHPFCECPPAHQSLSGIRGLCAGDDGMMVSEEKWMFAVDWLVPLCLSSFCLAVPRPSLLPSQLTAWLAPCLPPWALCSPTQPVLLANGWLITRWKLSLDAKPGISQGGWLCLSNLTSLQRPARAGGARGSSCPGGSAAERARK